MMTRGLYNESYRIAADSDLLFRYLLGGDITVAYLHEYIVKMRMGGHEYRQGTQETDVE